MKNLVLALSLLTVSVGGGLAAPSTGHAQAACVTKMINAAIAGGGAGNNFALVIQPTSSNVNNRWISYTAGYWYRDSTGRLYGRNRQLGVDQSGVRQQFSDRTTSIPQGRQNFTINNPDSQTVYLYPSGQLTIVNNSWNFTTIVSNPVCKGDLIEWTDGNYVYTVNRITSLLQ